MKTSRIGIAMFVLFVIGISIFTRIQIQQEKKYQIEDILNKGSYLVSIISLHPIRDLEGDKRSFFLRTLSEYASYEGLVYFFIHDHTGHSLISLAPSDLASNIPNDIQVKSLYTMGLTKQTFKVSGSGHTIYEFAKPIFEKGQRTGTVRLGLKLPPISLFSLERISRLAMITFFIFAAISLGYYGITLALKPLKNLNQDLRRTYIDSAPVITSSVESGRIAPILESLEQSLAQIKERLNQTETDNMELTSKLGVITFEKNQIINVLDSISFGIIITDFQGNVNHINYYMLNLLNRPLEDVVDHPLGEILEHDEITSFIAQQGTLEQTKTVSHIETTFPELAPEEIFQVSSSDLSDGDGVVIGKAIFAKNITMEKSAEKAKYEFITHIAHELRTPLTTIKSYNEMLMGGEIDDGETQKEFYNTISDETDRLSRLIENLLNISKMEMGSLSLNTGLVKTDLLVKDCIAAIEVPAQKKHITTEKNLPDKFPSLVGDKQLLKVAIINILSNAVKYTPENGTITFSLNEQDNTIIFDVIDTGYGISQEDLPRVFDKFFRSAEPNVAEQTGTGLGMAISLEIIHLHGGKIDVQSELGKGTRFTITIPKEQYYLGEQ
jgi:two-component system phosphate regulon sensor histidine kinase PhoR